MNWWKVSLKDALDKQAKEFRFSDDQGNVTAHYQIDCHQIASTESFAQFFTPFHSVISLLLAPCLLITSLHRNTNNRPPCTTAFTHSNSPSHSIRINLPLAPSLTLWIDPFLFFCANPSSSLRQTWPLDLVPPFSNDS